MKPHLTKMLKHKSLISSLLMLSGLVSIGGAASMSLINTGQKDKIKSVNNLVSEFALSEKSSEINKIFYNNALLKTRSISESQNNNLLPKATHYIVSLVELIFPFNSNEVKKYIKDSVALIKENLKGKFAIDVDKNSYFLWINFNEITKFENDFNMNFLQKASFIDDAIVKLNKKREFTNNSINSKEREKLYNNLEIESSYNSNFASNRFDESNRYENIKMSSNNLNQNRIKVGVLEVGEGEKQKEALIDVYDKNYFKINTKNPRVYNRWDFFASGGLLVKPTYGAHATKVGSIIGGFNGVNPYTDLYGVKLNSSNGPHNEFDYLISNNVNVINNSYGVSDNSIENWKFNYNHETKYIDFLNRTYPEIIFVYGAGNNADKNHKYKAYLGNDQLSYNSIVVGANDANLERTNFSSYKSTTNKKINLLANGFDYKHKGAYLGHGTSFAAPFISGLLSIHLKKNKHIFDKGKNNIIAMSALSSSTYDKNLSNQTQLNDNGSGFLDASKFDYALNSLEYFKVSEPKLYLSQRKVSPSRRSANSNSKKEHNTKSIYLKKGDVVRGSLVWLYSGTMKNSKPVIDDFDLSLYNNKGKLIISSNGTNQNIEFIKHKVQEEGFYNFKINQFSKDLSLPLTELAFTSSVGKD